MAFFGSKAHGRDERALRRSLSVERPQQGQSGSSRSSSTQGHSQDVPPIPSASSSSSSGPHKRAASRRQGDLPRATPSQVMRSAKQPQSSGSLSVLDNAVHRSRSSPELPHAYLPQLTAGPTPKADRRERSIFLSHSSSPSISAGHAAGADIFGRPYTLSDGKMASSPASSMMSTPPYPFTPPNKPFGHSHPRSPSGSPLRMDHPDLAYDTGVGLGKRRKSSGNISDGSMSRLAAAAAPLDMKRLLSKPAQPPSASTLSALSDAERSPRLSPGGRFPTRSTTTDSSSLSRLPSPMHDAAPRDRQRTWSRESELRSGRQRMHAHAGSLNSPGTPLARDWASERAPKPRIVHERRASDVAAPVPLPRSASASAVPAKLHVAARPATAQGVSRSVSADARPPPGLTPAGAVAHAYKQQERRRDDLARTDPEEYVDADDKPNAPYYTVFGASSGRLVAVGSALDSVWDHYLSEAEVTGPDKAISSRLRRKVSLKTSWKWKKQTPVENSDVSAPVDDVYDGSKARPGTKERLAAVPKEKKRKPPKLSIDEVADMDDGGMKSSRSLPSAKLWTPSKSPAADNIWTLEKGEHGLRERSKTKGKGKIDEHSPGGKIWKLVKRLSSGALKDTYQHQARDDPPPVPAIPRDFLQSSNPRHTMERGNASAEMDRVTEPGVFLRFVKSRPSLSVPRPSTAISSRRDATSPATRLPSTANEKHQRIVSSNSAETRPSTTTRSSSPSSHFFNRAHSVRSSTSSYGEILPPPNKVVERNVSLEEWHRPNKKHGVQDVSSPTSRARFAGRSRPRTADGKLPDVVLSQPPLGSSSDSLPDSPMIPTFSTERSVNSFPRQRSSPDQQPQAPEELTQVLRTDLDTALIPEEGGPQTPRPSHRKFLSQVSKVTVSSVVFPVLPAREKIRGDRPAAESNSMSFESDNKQESSGTARTDTAVVSPLKFRELKESPRHAWTEQEKADKWDDLLERSAQAGGTLHVGIGGLLSDNISDSGHSDT